MITKVELNKGINDFDKVKENIILELNNPSRIDVTKVAHVNYLNLVITFGIYFEDGNERGTAQVTNNLCKYWNVDANDLLALALENTPKFLKPNLNDLNNVIGEMLLGIETEMKMSPMMVLTNEIKYKGASVMLYDGVLSNIGKAYGTNFFIIPSSKHELIILQDVGGMDANAIKEMIHTVNATELSEEDVLSNSLYYYDRKAKDVKVL